MSAGPEPTAPASWTASAPQLVMAYSVCRGITRSAAKNFYYAFLLLPRRKRESLCAVYAFMRRCDDITDDPVLTLPERRRKLDQLLDALHHAQQNNPTDDPIFLALVDTQRRFQIPAGRITPPRALAEDLDRYTAHDAAFTPLQAANRAGELLLRLDAIAAGRHCRHDPGRRAVRAKRASHGIVLSTRHVAATHDECARVAPRDATVRGWS